MRSLLFIPTDDERKLAKGVASGADALLLDLEDAVAAPRKAAARALAARYLAEQSAREGRPKLYVRINALDTGLWQDDLASVIGALPDGILLPKARFDGADEADALAIAICHANHRSVGWVKRSADPTQEDPTDGRQVSRASRLQALGLRYRSTQPTRARRGT